VHLGRWHYVRGRLGEWQGDRQGEVWASGDVYEGDGVNGKETGKGKFTLTNDNVYKGDYVDCEWTGRGSSPGPVAICTRETLTIAK
jgi:hypothetical protein